MLPVGDLCQPCRAAHDRWLFHRWPAPRGWIEGVPGTERAARLSFSNYDDQQQARRQLVRESLDFIRTRCTGPTHDSPYTLEGRNKK